MGKRRSMIRKKNYDEACGTNTIRTFYGGGMPPWSDLHHDVLLLVMMKLGVVDFLAFNGVCKSWRSFAISNKNKFMVSRVPMCISFDANQKQCIEDFEGRKFKITLPYFDSDSHFDSGRMWCIGVTSGYLILWGEKTNDCLLVNLITRHELHFPDRPSDVFCCPAFFKAILVFSPSISAWMFVVLNKCHFRLWFSISGKEEWNYVSTPFATLDLHAFKGKIYTVHSVDIYKSDEIRLCEMRLHPEPKLVLLNIKNHPKPVFSYSWLVSYGENLYVIDRGSNIHTRFMN